MCGFIVALSTDCVQGLYRMDDFPDLGSLSNQELTNLIEELVTEEMELSYRRRILHGKIEILRAELINRRRKRGEGEDDITGPGSPGVREPRRPKPGPGSGTISLPVPEVPDEDPGGPPPSLML